MLHLHWGGSIEHGKEMHGSFRPSAHSLGLSTRPLKNRGSLAKSQGYRHLGWSGDASKIVFHFFFFFKWVRGAFHRWHCVLWLVLFPTRSLSRTTQHTGQRQSRGTSGWTFKQPLLCRAQWPPWIFCCFSPGLGLQEALISVCSEFYLFISF